MQNSARLRERTVWQALDRLNADSPRKGSGKGGEGSGMARFYAFIFMLVGWFSVIGHYVAKSDFHSLAGTIDGLQGLRPGANIRVKPYGLAS